MAAIRLLFILILIFLGSPSLMLAAVSSTIVPDDDQPQLPSSRISAAPALLPDAPLTSPPALSPDITPLFPSPGGSELSPSESSLPTIPSSPSPPNPDAIGAPGPVMALSPFGSLPLSSSHQLKVSVFLSSTFVPALLAFW
ncbi:hypothetical protein ACH5RR_020083 [Cinchona calisaya]|uniref:Uncharacterized protein n=1 Tax=Cinchona calisaya TaxID=153742 RepID=A0ABD2ZEP1_9GENT